MTDLVIVNIPLLRKAVEWVEEQAALPIAERQWDQKTYRGSAELVGRTCGTVMCVAGYVADLHGVQWKSEHAHVTADGEYAEDIARQLLGLDFNQSLRLFYGGNDATNVRTIAEDIAGERL